MVRVPVGLARRLPWIDGFAALAVGTLLLALRSVLAGFYGLSLELVTLVGVFNVIYAAPGLSLGALRTRPAWLLRCLIVANLAWVVACIVIAARVWSSARVFGLAHIIGEGLFVGGLALLEARHWREILAVKR